MKPINVIFLVAFLASCNITPDYILRQECLRQTGVEDMNCWSEEARARYERGNIWESVNALDVDLSHLEYLRHRSRGASFSCYTTSGPDYTSTTCY